MSLDKIIGSQKTSKDKGGVGLEEGQSSMSTKEEQQKKNADIA